MTSRDINKLLINLKALDFLYKKDSNAVRSIMTVVKFESTDEVSKQIRRHQDLAQFMLNKEGYERVVAVSKELILDPDTLAIFLDLLGEQPTSLLQKSQTLVREFMSPIGKNSVFNERSTLLDLIKFTQTATDEKRFFFVVDAKTQILRGIVSVNDIERNISMIKGLSKDVPVTELPFYNANPSVVLDTDSMEFVNNKFEEARKSGKYLTKIIVVDESRKLVGILGQPDISRWQLSLV